MRALKTILIIILALGVILAILAFTGPKSSVVKRSVVIEAPPAAIYPMISSLRNMHEWSPWKNMDRDQENEWTGTDGAVGSIQTWRGDTVGVGSQEIKAMEQDRKVTTELKFLEPWESSSTVDLELTPEGTGTRVDWIMTQEHDGMGRLMAVFMDIDKMVGPDFERGLASLKAMTEERELAAGEALKAKTHRGYVIETVERPTTTYIGKRAKVKFADMEKFFGTNFPGAYAAAGASGIQPAGQPTSIFFEWDEKNMIADVMAAIPVQAAENVTVKGFETYTVPTSKMLHIPYYGAYDRSENAHYAMDEMIKANELTHYGNVLEEYVTDPTTEPDTAKWLTNIYYMIR
ncbi:MAG: SRPBCC family protein [Bacteroidota bacterium]|nr:SRPBCC family protein [Bacteroidota bacterium]